MTDDEKILTERAAALSVRKKDPAPDARNLPVVEFILLPESYCIDATCISEIIPSTEPTPLPGVPAFVRGVANLRGRIISVVDLKSFLQLKEIGMSEMNKIIVIRHGRMEMGIIADSVTGMREIDAGLLHPPPATISPTAAGFITGVTPDGLILLDARGILESELLTVNQK